MVASANNESVKRTHKYGRRCVISLCLTRVENNYISIKWWKEIRQF